MDKPDVYYRKDCRDCGMIHCTYPNARAICESCNTALTTVTDEDVERVGRAISDALEVDAYGSYDYSRYPGDSPPYVVRDQRTGEAVFRSHDHEAASAEWRRLCRAFVARAALEAFLRRR